MQQKYRAVIFDFGGVFTTSPVEQFAAFEEQHGLPYRFLGGVIKANHDTNAWAKYERAEIDRETFDRAFAEETRAAGHEVSGNTLLSLLRLEIKPEMVEAHKQVVAAGFKTGCITNNLPDMDSAAMLSDQHQGDQAADVLKRFDQVIESSKVGVRKPEPQIYLMMCDALGVAPEQSLFLDDLGINLKPAQTLGMATIKVPFGDVQPAIDEMWRYLHG